MVPDGSDPVGFGARALVVTRLLVFWASGNSDVYGKIENVEEYLVIR